MTNLALSLQEQIEGGLSCHLTSTFWGCFTAWVKGWKS